MKKKTGTQLHLEKLVEKLVEKFPLLKKHGRLVETAGLVGVLKTPCLVWNRGKSSNGYGKVCVNGIQKQATRYSYEFSFERSPGKLFVCHQCDNPECISPHHLFLGTQKINLNDMRKKGRAGKGGGKGNANPKSIFNSGQVVQMRNLFSSGERICRIHEKFGGSYQAVRSIVYRQSWKHINP